MENTSHFHNYGKSILESYSFIRSVIIAFRFSFFIVFMMLNFFFSLGLILPFKLLMHL